ncbi:MAG: Na(+)-translocating NADH-quinone reductase subunit A [Bacteroidetes bacterium]|nr:MAG: Na(+)-translocating NADH-quinone reductase subunit A [Bacteroidota bacterium]
MSEVRKFTKGFDVRLAGKAQTQIANSPFSDTFALKPSDFIGMYRPKVVVQQGESVKAGQPIFYDKKLEKVMYTSPVSGEIVEIKRGEKRKLLEVIILADKTIEYVPFQKYSISEISGLKKEDLTATILQSGAWVNVIQRPYGIVADPNVAPKAIFISTFDTHPLAPDNEFVFKGQEQYFQAGVDVLKKVGACNVHVGLKSDTEISKIFGGVKNAQTHKFAGPHPAGNVGVQIHHIAPINKDEVVWTLTPYAVIQIGKLFLDGKYDASKLVALAGSEVNTPQYYKTFAGACLDKIVAGNIKQDHVRYVSGNVLTGQKVDKKGYMGFYDQMITVLPEGDHARFFLTDGWLAPTSRPSFHRAWGLFSFLSPTKEHVVDTNNNGQERAFVLTGTFEQVVPMDILPLQLIKSILANDYENMEALGIFEVIEEDFALCEFVDVSKQPIQEILRHGISMMMEG